MALKIFKKLFPLFGLLAVLLVLFTRTLGIHVDEHTYLFWAMVAPLGDSFKMGKPPFFYFLNYCLYNFLGPIFGWLQPVSIHILYSVSLVFSLYWLSQKLTESREKSIWFFFICLLSPFFLFNSTQLMMETPVLVFLSLCTVGLCKLRDLNSNEDKKALLRAHLLVGASSFFAFFLKETAAPALLVLACGFFSLRKRLASLGAGLILAFLFNLFLLSRMNAPDHSYGGLSNLFNASLLAIRASSFSQYVWMWIFFVGPFSLFALGYLLLREKMFRTKTALPFLLMLALSLLSTIAFEFISNEDFARYCYPVIWIGLLSAATLLVQTHQFIKALVIAAYFFPVANMWGLELKGIDEFPRRLNLWPKMVSREAYYSGYTILPGVAIHGWVLRNPTREGMCIFVPKKSTEKPWLLVRYFSMITSHASFYDEDHIAEYRSCKGPKAVLRRQYQIDPLVCDPTCPTPQFSVSNCTIQEMQGWAQYPRPLTNRTCLP